MANATRGRCGLHRRRTAFRPVDRFSSHHRSPWMTTAHRRTVPTADHRRERCYLEVSGRLPATRICHPDAQSGRTEYPRARTTAHDVTRKEQVLDSQLRGAPSFNQCSSCSEYPSRKTNRIAEFYGVRRLLLRGQFGVIHTVDQHLSLRQRPYKPNTEPWSCTRKNWRTPYDQETLPHKAIFLSTHTLTFRLFVSLALAYRKSAHTFRIGT